MTFRKHMIRQAPHLMLTFGLGLIVFFVAVYDELVWL